MSSGIISLQQIIRDPKVQRNKFALLISEIWKVSHPRCFCIKWSPSDHTGNQTALYITLPPAAAKLCVNTCPLGFIISFTVTLFTKSPSTRSPHSSLHFKQPHFNFWAQVVVFVFFFLLCCLLQQNKCTSPHLSVLCSPETALFYFVFRKTS